MKGYLLDRLRRLVNNEYARREWVKSRLFEIPSGSLILDAGCGGQQYREFCEHLKYFSQDFGQYSTDKKDSYTAGKTAYKYGKLDYTGNIWKINEKDSFFDTVLCTEVFEHIPFPNETVTEFSRLLKAGGRVILTVPSNCLRHMDPYFFYSGFSDRYLELVLKNNGFVEIAIEPVGSYHNWLMVEEARCMRHQGFMAMLFLLPAFAYHYMRQRNPGLKEIYTLCSGYHVTAVKKAK